jgi:hypothetical protein
MVLQFLIYICFAGGVVAILYSFLALLSWMRHVRVQKDPADKHGRGFAMMTAGDPADPEVFWKRAKILLQNERFDAALADCKRILEIDPNHAGAKSLWEHLVPPEPVPIIPEGKSLPLVAEAERISNETGKEIQGTEPEQAEPAAPVPAARERGTEDDTFNPEPGETGDAVSPQDKVKSKLLLLLRLKYLKK